MQIEWDAEVAGLLNELLATQDGLLALLSEKRELLVKADTAGLAALAPREQELIDRLQACQKRRTELLALAGRQGLPSQSIRSLARSLPAERRVDVDSQVAQAAHRARLLRHHSLAQWVLVQRSLLHLSQLLEIIATGGRQRPTYEKGESHLPGGALVDHAV